MYEISLRLKSGEHFVLRIIRIFDFVDENLPRLYEDDENFSYAEYLGPIDIVADVVSSCTFEIQYLFHRWINTIHYKKGFRKNMLYLDPNAAYLNFNYTLFLGVKLNISNRCTKIM